MRIRVLLLIILGTAACSGCGGCGQTKTTEELFVDVKSHEERDRIIAVRTLPTRNADPARTVAALIEALKDAQSDIRRSAAVALGRMGETAKEAIPALQAAMHDRDARIRIAARNALSRIDPTLGTQASGSKSGG